MGFDGKTLIHPGQVEGANAAFAPSEQAVEDARGLIQAFEDGQGSGVVTYNGRMVENLHVESARRTLEHPRGDPGPAGLMRAVVQRVLGASVTVAGEVVGAIDGAGPAGLPRRHPRRRPGRRRLDRPQDLGPAHPARRAVRLRRRRRRCSSSASSRCTATPARAGVPPGRPPHPGPVSEPLYDAVCAALRDLGATRRDAASFGADMQVSSVNDGPITMILDSPR